MTLDDKLVFDLPCWDNVTSMAKDLISRLLMKDQKQRITLDNAMAHPWFEQARARHAGMQNSPSFKSQMLANQKKKSSFATKSPMRVHSPPRD